ncbi:MAG: hypothetical protein MJZ59_00985 [Paludibacteraceae bacterium]|nr:hypothetical protein [Paludibacteraceae bacterium]
MKHFNFNQSLKNLVNNLKGLFILSLALTTFGVGNVWGGYRYAKIYVYSEPTTGGYVYANTSNSGSAGTLHSDNASNSGWKTIGSMDFTFYLFAKAESGYTFKGFSSTQTSNSGDTSNPFSKTITAETKNDISSKPATATYYAIFARMTADVSSKDFGNVNVGQSSSATTITITHAHASKITAALSGTNASDFSLSKTTIVDNSVSESTATFTVTFKPTCNGTRQATLTLSSTNGLNNVTISLSGTGVLNDQSLSWDNVSTIELNMLNGTTQNISATASSGLAVSYSSNKPDVLLVDATGKLTAKSVGEATITASQAGDCTYSAATSISKTFQVKTKDTPIFTPNWSSTNLKVGDKVTLGVQYVNDGLDGSFKAKDYDSNILKVTRESNTITIEALNEGSSNITFAQTETDAIFSASETYSFTVSKIANTLAADATHSMKVDETWNGVISGKNSDATVTTTTSDETVAYYDVTNNKIFAQNTNNQSFNSKEVTITISQAATYKYTAASKTIKVTVTKHNNNISINGSQDSYQAAIYMEAQQAINLTATNTNYSGSPITATQTAGNTIALLNAAQTQVTSNHNLGDATWTVSQPENYKYKAANATFTIHVVKQAETTDCYVLNAPAEKSYGKYGDCENKSYQDFTLTGPGKTLSFNMWKYSGANDIGMKVYGYDASGNQVFLQEYSIGSMKTSAYPYSFDISSNVTRIRIQNGGGSYVSASTLNCYASDVRVTRATYLNASDITIDTQSDNTTLIYPGMIGTGFFHVEYSLANGGDLQIVCDNDKFTIDKFSKSEVDCKTGSFDVNMTYTSQNAGTDYAHVVIYNKVYRKEITVTGITQKHQQTLNWKENFDKMSKGGEEKSAASSSHGLVTYTSSNTDVIRVDNDESGHATVLVAVAKGEAEITATAAGDDEFDPISISKTISVTEDHVQYIIWNQSLMGLKYELGSTKTLTAYATSEEEGNMASSRPITYTSDNTSVVTVNGNQLTITGIGTAIVTARQAGGTIAGITYEPVEKTNKVIVKDPSAKCESFVYEQGNEAEEFFSMNITTPELIGTEHTLNGEPAKLTFYAKREYWNLAIDYSKGNIVVDAYTPTGGWTQVLDCKEPPIGSYQEYSKELSRDVTKIRFRRPKGGQGYHYIADAKIERARYIETTTPSVFQANVGEVQEHKISLSYSNITSDLLLTLAGGATSHFSIDKTTIEGECGDAKKNIELTISYAPTKDTEGNVDGKEQETLNITDGTTTYQVALYGKASKVDQHIVWDINDNNNVYTIEQVTLTATTKTNLDQAAGELAYHIVGASTDGCGTIDNNTLSFSKNGIVYVEAYTIASDKYNPATSVTKSWTVSKTPTKVTTKPTISGDIISGTDIASLILNGGAAQNTVNNQSVEGTFAITSGNLVNVGQQTLTITFTPNNTDMYESCTTTITVNVVKREATENKFTNAAGDNDWKNEENWTNGVPTEENPDVIIAGEVTIDEPISVGGLTIEVNGKVTVVDNGSLNVNGTSADRDTYGNLFIKNGGDVTIDTEGNVRVNDFVIESSIGTQGVSESGQITNADRVLYVNGAYIDINLDPTGKANDTQWYGFTVPFPVNIYNGVARKEGDTFRKVTYGTDYIFAEYDMNQRLNSGKGWKNISTPQLQPGRFYYITFNGDYNTYSFKAATNTITTSYTTDLTINGTGANANWNAVGNSALRHVTASYGTTDDETFVQVYQNGLSQYQTVRTSDATFVVGCPFFVQAKVNTVLQLTDADNDPIDNTYAPLRKVSKANRSIKMVITPENGGYSDQVYMRTTTDAKSEYIIGRDLAKAGVGTATVQMWINAYGQKLSVNETEIVGEEAIFPLGIYAPKAGGYRLTIDETSTPTYLMENGVVIWDFANGSYVVDLSKGTNNDYSIVRTAPNAPGEATNIYSAQQNNQSINKVIFRNKMYIIHNAHTYDAQGQTIR